MRVPPGNSWAQGAPPQAPSWWAERLTVVLGLAPARGGAQHPGREVLFGAGQAHSRHGL